MNHNKIRIFGAAAIGAIWLFLVVFAWTKPADELSEAERRKLAQFPTLSVETVLNGEFMESLRTIPWTSSPFVTASVRSNPCSTTM